MLGSAWYSSHSGNHLASFCTTAAMLSMPEDFKKTEPCATHAY